MCCTKKMDKHMSFTLKQSQNVFIHPVLPLVFIDSVDFVTIH